MEKNVSARVLAGKERWWLEDSAEEAGLVKTRVHGFSVAHRALSM